MQFGTSAILQLQLPRHATSQIQLLMHVVKSFTVISFKIHLFTQHKNFRPTPWNIEQPFLVIMLDNVRKKGTFWAVRRFPFLSYFWGLDELELFFFVTLRDQNRTCLWDLLLFRLILFSCSVSISGGWQEEVVPMIVRVEPTMVEDGSSNCVIEPVLLPQQRLLFAEWLPLCVEEMPLSMIRIQRKCRSTSASIDATYRWWVSSGCCGSRTRTSGRASEWEDLVW